MVQATWSEDTADQGKQAGALLSIPASIMVKIYQTMVLFSGPGNWHLLADPVNQGRCIWSYLPGFKRQLPAAPLLPTPVWILEILPCVPSSASLWGWHRKSLFSCPSREGGTDSWQHREIILASSSKERTDLSCTSTIAHTCPPCSNFHPLQLAQLQAGLLMSFLFFPVTIKCHTALSCVLNCVINWPQRFTLTGLNNSTKNYSPLHFLLLMTSVTRITTDGLWQLQGIM